ncbi:MAG TPA: glycosyltransferase [Bryobacteraceae bacterium]|nr:glycosyltransferase [Bryobacteraceae bacterium]
MINLTGNPDTKDRNSGLQHETPGGTPITVAILNYRRLPELSRLLQTVSAQEYRPVQVIVVDNNSGPDILPLIRRKSSGCTLIELADNVGTSARNRAIGAASSEIVVMLDNDVSLADSSALREIAAAFDRHPNAGCINFGINNPGTNERSARDWCHPWVHDRRDCWDRQTTFISEGACAFRRSVFNAVEPYWDALFINMEGADLAFRMLEAGFEIWYTPAVEVHHFLSDETREGGRDFYHNPRNLILLGYRDIPASRLFGFLAPRLAALAWCSLLRGYFSKFIAGVWGGLTYVARARHVRRPVRQETMDKFDQLRSDARSRVSRLVQYWKCVG